MTKKQKITQRIKEKAIELGFMTCGISKVEFLEKEATYLENWLKNGMHGNMSYMENHFDMRLDPSLLVDGAKSVISVLLNYYPDEDLFKDKDLKISKYAYGTDYHFALKYKLKDLLKFVIDEVGDINARVFTDSAPIMDKAWAERSGLGWQGKNGMLISKQKGSFFFVGEIVLDVDLEYDNPTLNHCGTCTKCIDACPTDAIASANVIDGSKCISYLTIELKDEIIPKEFKNQMEGWMFGCDICQDVCPWNKFSKPHTNPEFNPHPSLKDTEWIELTDDIFRELFKKSPIKRTKLSGLKRNISFVKNNT
jgi:epoxyqueuosine reductase